jgi:hypothetical protein
MSAIAEKFSGFYAQIAVDLGLLTTDQQNQVLEVQAKFATLAKKGIRPTEKFLDKDPVFTGKGRGRKSFEVRLDNFIKKYDNDAGYNKLQQYIKDVSSVSEPFAKHFAEQYKDKFAKWEGVVKNDPKYQSNPDEKFDDLITKTFGKDVLKAYREIPPTPPVGSRAGSATPPTPPLPKSLEDKIDASMEKVDWVNKLEDIKLGLTKTEKFLLTDSLWFRATRAQIKYILDGAFKKEDEIIERMTELLKSATDDLTNFEMVTTKFKSIDILLERLSKNKNFQKQAVYDVIRKNLNDKVGFVKGNKIMEKLKSTESLSSEYPTWIQDFISTSHYTRAFGLNKFNIPKGLSNLIERTKMGLISGDIRKVDEVFNDFIKNNPTWKGFLKYYLWMQLVTKAFIPAFYGFIFAITYGFRSESNKNPKKFLKAWETGILLAWENIFLVQKKDWARKIGLKENEINWLATLSPWHDYLRDIIEGLDKFDSGAYVRYTERAAAEAENKFKSQVNILQKEIDRLRKQGVNKGNELLDKGKEKSTKVVTNIVDGEAGFRAWCKLKNITPKEPKPYDTNSGLATTNDDKQWYYENGTFKPNPE